MNFVNRIIAGGFLILYAATANAQYVEAGGEVAFEAENYHSIVGSGGSITHDWVSVCDNTLPVAPGFVSGYSGDGTMQASPADGTTFINMPDALTDAPRLDYQVEFNTAGNYTIWVLGRAVNTASNSVHIGVDGAELAGMPANGTSMPVGGTYQWVSAAATLDLSSLTAPEAHTINLYMRESGVFVDLVYLTANATDPNVTPPTANANVGAPLLNAAVPSINPNGGSFFPNVDVTLTTCTPGASIYWSDDGVTAPFNGGPNGPFTADFTLTADTTIMAAAFAAGTNASTVATADFSLNQAPSITSSAVTAVDEDSPYTYNVTSVDPDNPGETLVVSATTLPGWLTLTDGGSGDGTASLAGTPTDAEVGSHPVVLVVTDQDGETGTQSFTVTVNNVNDDGLPVAVDDPDAATTSEGTPVTTVNVLLNDTLVDNAAISAFDSPSVNGATVVNLGNGTFNYSPMLGFTGSDTFTYTLTDDDGESDSATVTVTVTGVPILAAATLPTSRSVQVGSPATAFGTIINSSAVDDATDCGIAPRTTVLADFGYQTTDPNTNAPTGTPNTPVDIAAGAGQSYVFAFTPTAEISPTNVELDFVCANTNPAPVTVGLNTLLLSASNTPVPDIVALAATPSNDGIVNLSGTNGSNAFAVSAVNVGSTDTITAEPRSSVALPLELFICETNPTSGACVTPVDSSTTSSISAGATPTYSVFVTATGAVPFDPANNRIIVEFKDAGGVVRGATSVAVRTQ